MIKSSLGSEEDALAIARRARQRVAAYGQFLDRHGIGDISAMASLPLMDKKNYMGPSAYKDLLADDYGRTFTIFKSSGSSGQSFYWPQLKDEEGQLPALMRQFFETSFRIHERRTLVIVGLALGSWIGGEHVSWAMKSLAQTLPYTFSVFSPGSVHEEILAMIRNADAFVDQILIFLCPSAITHLHLKAAELGYPLPYAKLRYMVLGEPFPESLRLSLQKRSGIPASEPVILSLYGSADTGFLGVESPATALLRQVLTTSPETAAQLGFPGTVPHFFHFVAPRAFLETVAGELCVTRWQGIPLIRYNLHDSATLFDWTALVERLREIGNGQPPAARLAAALQAFPPLPDIIAIAGRSDGCLILCGTNISETMLDDAVRADALSAWLTGHYKARIVYEDNRQYLEWDLEWRQEAPMDAGSVDQVYRLLVQSLGHAQPEFLDDWKNVYRSWDQDPLKRILRINPVRWPTLSSRLEGGGKHRGLRE